MSYRDHLWRMLEPLGIYRGDGFSGGELAALGAGMDRLREAYDRNLRETPVVTAEEAGLEMAESLFSMAVSQDTGSRRENLKTLFQTDHGAFTQSALTETLEACGIPVTLNTGEEAFTATAVLGRVLTMEDDPVWIMETLERVLPCHLMVMISFAYVDSAAAETVSAQEYLKTLRTWTRGQWEELLGQG